VQPQSRSEFVKQLRTSYYDVRLFSSGSGDCAPDRCWGSSATGVERRRSSTIQQTTFHRVIEIILKAIVDETLAAKLGLPPSAIGTTLFLDFHHVSYYEVQISEDEVIVGDAQTPVTSFTPFGPVLWDDYLPQGGRTEFAVVVTQGAGLESEQQFLAAPNRFINHTLSLEYAGGELVKVNGTADCFYTDEPSSRRVVATSLFSFSSLVQVGTDSQGNAVYEFQEECSNAQDSRDEFNSNLFNDYHPLRAWHVNKRTELDPILRDDPSKYGFRIIFDKVVVHPAEVRIPEEQRTILDGPTIIEQTFGVDQPMLVRPLAEE